MHRRIVLSIVLVTLIAGHLPAAALESDDELMAAEAAREFSRLEAKRAFHALYDELHPDAQAVVPRETVVGWYREFLANREAGELNVTAVRFVTWTWPVTGITYANTAEIDFVQPFWVDDVQMDVSDTVRLVLGGGEWRWFFGRSREFVEEQIVKHRDSSAVRENVYTSPQFGYQVTWEDTWAPFGEDSFVGEYDDLTLTAGDLYLRYTAFYTDLDPAAMFGRYAESWRQSYPDLVVTRDYQGAQSQLHAIVTFTDDAGKPIEETVSIHVLTPRKSLLIVSQGAPEGTPPDEIGFLVAAVHFDLEPRAVDSVSPADDTATSESCGNADRWWGDTSPRLDDLAGMVEVFHQFIQLPEVSPDIFRANAERFDAMAQDQRDSNPPPAASELNVQLVEVFESYGTAMELAAALVGGGANPLLATALRANLATALDVADSVYLQASGAVDAFLAHCQP